jgi:putative Ca2+/H+ antiporter (TMEM165/GDT1 family)
MDFKLMLTTFGMIFLAELGDKTQLATVAFAAEGKSRLAVFIGAAGALTLTSLFGVAFGAVIAKLIPYNYIKNGAGVLFVILGFWVLFSPAGK